MIEGDNESNGARNLVQAPMNLEVRSCLFSWVSSLLVAFLIGKN
jgi:hypothetical protein